MKKHLLIVLLFAMHEVLCMDTGLTAVRTDKTETNLPENKRLNLTEIRDLVQNRISEIEVSYIDFNGKDQKMLLKVFDVVSDSVRAIFKELHKIGFPIYMIMSYENREIAGSEVPSVHSYGLAIDVNEHLNPSYKVIGAIIDPARDPDEAKDLQLIHNRLASLGVPKSQISIAQRITRQPADSDDWFLNRNLIRPGMVTKEIAEIFYKHGFDIWGGNWRHPMDFMHFQCSQSLAEQLAQATPEDGRHIWTEHVEQCREELRQKHNNPSTKAPNCL